MTVKDAVSVLKGAKEIRLAFGGSSIEFDKDNALMMDAYGSYVVDEIFVFDNVLFELAIATLPVKAGS